MLPVNTVTYDVYRKMKETITIEAITIEEKDISEVSSVKYSLEERMEIGRKIYDKELNKEMAAIKYGINVYTARDYLRYYKAWKKAQEEEQEETTA